MFTYFTIKRQVPNNSSNTVISNDVSMKEFDHIKGDDERNNATVMICDM